MLARTLQFIQQQLAVALDDSKQIIEVVGDAAGETTNSFHLLRLAKLFLQGPPLGHVFDDLFKAGEYSL